MGNGSSSRPPNTVVVRPAETNRTTFASTRNDLGETSNQRNLTNGEVGHTNLEIYHTPLQPSCPTEFELDDSIEVAAAPAGLYGSDFPQGTSTLGQRNVQSKQKTKKVFQGKQTRSSSDEIVFEVYRSYADGNECMVLNDEGTRFYLDSWETGLSYLQLCNHHHHHCNPRGTGRVGCP